MAMPVKVGLKGDLNYKGPTSRNLGIWVFRGCQLGAQKLEVEESKTQIPLKFGLAIGSMQRIEMRIPDRPYGSFPAFEIQRETIKLFKFASATGL